VTGKSKGYGFVKFASEDEAAAALHKMGGEVGLLSCGARQAQVRMFCYNMHYFANAIVPFDEIASGDWWKEHKGTLCKQRMIWCHFFLEE
jgi:RNA recognition motif-containing protein